MIYLSLVFYNQNKKSGLTILLVSPLVLLSYPSIRENETYQIFIRLLLLPLLLRANQPAAACGLVAGL
jgi:hypothetical protein